MTSIKSPQIPLHQKFFQLFTEKRMVDVTLAADGQFIFCHKIILAAVSKYFEVMTTNTSNKRRSWN